MLHHGNTNQRRRLLYSAEPDTGRLLREHRYDGRRRGGPLPGPAAFRPASLSHNYTFIANFTDSYCLSDYDFGAALAGSTNSQIFNRHADWGPCISDTRYNFNASVVAHSSLDSGSNVWANRLLSDWQLSPLFYGAQRPAAEQSRRVRTIRAPDLAATTGPTRCWRIASDQSDLLQTARSAFSRSIRRRSSRIRSGTYGDVGRNALRGPGFFGFDVSLSRIFKITERYSLQVRAEAFNILNHTNFVGGFAPAGQPAGASYGTLSTASELVHVRTDHRRLRSSHSAVRDEALLLTGVLHFFSFIVTYKFAAFFLISLVAFGQAGIRQTGCFYVAGSHDSDA